MSERRREGSGEKLDPSMDPLTLDNHSPSSTVTMSPFFIVIGLSVML